MMRRRDWLARPLRPATLTLVISACAVGYAPASASALNPIKPICGVAGWVSGLAGKACGAIQHGDRLVKAGKKLLTGHVGGAAKALVSGGAAPKPSTVIGLAAIGAWVFGGAKVALHETAKVLGETTSPQLGTTWFSSTYWRMAGIAALLTLPFLFAAAVQALLRSDLSLLARSALGYLPLSLLAVSVAAPLTMLLLAASDEMSAIVSSAAGHAGTRFLAQAGTDVGVLSVLSHSPFLAFLVGLLTAAGAIVLWIEMLIREAAVYIVVLMLPLAFAALVWPARRIWAIRAVELLVALILSKFAIVAVLALGGAALGQRGAGGAGGMLAGLVLVVLGAFAPWALVRLLPLTELASGAAGQMRGEAGRLLATRDKADRTADQATDWAGSITAGMRRQADESSQAASDRGPANGAGAEITKLAAGRTDGGSGATVPVAAGDNGAPAAASTNGISPAASTEGTSSTNATPAANATPVANAIPVGTAPALSEIWRADDQTETALILGLEGSSTKQFPEDIGGDTGAGGAAADDPDPLPPDQDPEDGRL
jgi:hypothetical protein